MIRGDLPHGVQAAQLIHAAGESAANAPVPPETRAVALAAPDEAALLALERRLREAGVHHVAIREPDAPHRGALMAIGLPPQPREPLRPLLGKLNLLR